MDQVKQVLIKRLEKKGMELCIIPGFIRSLANSFFLKPHMDLIQVNNQLRYMGWGNIELDYHTLQLALSCFEDEGLHKSEYKPASWFEKKFYSA
jgi:hypothetical protein